MTHSQPEPITPPENFPVTWENPDDAKLPWSRDRSHNPDPVTAMEASLGEKVGPVGIRNAMQFFGMPVGQSRARRINTYAYSANLPPALPPAEMAARGQQAQQKIMDRVSRLETVWQEQLAEYDRQFAAWDAFDFRAAGLPELLAHLDDSMQRGAHMFGLHLMVGFPYLMALSHFEDYYLELFPEKSALDAHRLLQGISNKTIEAAHALWRLSRQAVALPSIRQILAERAPAEVIGALEQSNDGRAFLAQLSQYLDMYGHSSDGVSWIAARHSENPTSIILQLQEFIKPGTRDPIAATARLAQEREQALADARSHLHGYPQAVVDRFELLLKSAQLASVISEDEHFYNTFKIADRLRRVLLAIGRQLSETGVLAEPADIVHLTLEELRETVNALPNIDRRSLVTARKAELEYWRHVNAPEQLGTRGPAAGGRAGASPMGRAGMKKFGPPPPATEANLVRGHAGSAGLARGTAKVIRTLDEAGKLQPGDILIAETTAPPWTPLFAVIAAVVTDTGGVLSHSAIVAREYGIPAVVGTGNATQVIRDGQMLEVDGSAGVVRLLPTEEII